jgi:hypothetical protein
MKKGKRLRSMALIIVILLVGFVVCFFAARKTGKVYSFVSGVRKKFINRNNDSMSSSLEDISIAIGDTREEIEKRVAQILQTQSHYNVYDGSIQNVEQPVLYTSNSVLHAHGSTVLEVYYIRGVPAPYVSDAQGQTAHYHPVDQTVASFRFLPANK